MRAVVSTEMAVHVVESFPDRLQGEVAAEPLPRQGQRIETLGQSLDLAPQTEGAWGWPMSTPRSCRRPFFQSSRERKRRAKQKTMAATVCRHPNCREGLVAAPRRWKTPHKSRRPKAT